MLKWNAFPMARVPWKALAGAALLFLWPAALYGAPITITKLQELNFGFCDATPSLTYIVLPAASPGAGACQGAGAARFDITGDPNKKAKITLANTVIITNGTEALTVMAPAPTPARNRYRMTGKPHVSPSVTAISFPR